MTDRSQQNMEALRAKIEADEAANLAAFRKHSGVTHSARETFKTYEAAASNAKKAANSAQYKVEQLRADDTMNPVGRSRLVKETIEKGRAEVKKQQDRMEATLQVLKAELSTAALPRLDKSREMAARDELRMILDGAPDPVGAMAELAGGDDELAAVAVSSYGESYLRAKGVANAQETAAKIRESASASAHQSADPTRRAIGEARGAFGELEKARVATQYFTREALDAAEEAGADA